MSITVKSGATSDTLTVDATSKAGRATLYDSAGREISTNVKQTYSAAFPAFTPPATPTTLFAITGSGTKTIRVISMNIGTVQTTAGVNRIYAMKRSTANSGGTSAAPTIVPHDSNNGAATATVLSYTVAPTTGSLVGNVAILNVYSPILATGTSAQNQDFPVNGVAWDLPQPVTLRGTGQVLEFNFNGAALPSGMSVTGNIIWTEE